MKRTSVAGITSTGSKRPDALFGADYDGPPLRMVRSAGNRVWDEAGTEYLDFVMALGAVALGYAHPRVNQAVQEAVERGAIGPLPPVEEAALAEELGRLIPSIEAVRFLKTGAEAVAAAVRLARVHTGRDHVLGCGYHGWLDWCSRSGGVPAATQALYGELPFNDIEQCTAMIRSTGDRLACVVIEPVVDAAPSSEWLAALREETRNSGALLVFDEIKTAFRVGLGGAGERWGGEPDLVVLGKALANGFPLAAVGGSAAVMSGIGQTWISSTMATDFVALAAARATLEVAAAENLPGVLAGRGGLLLAGLERLAERFPRLTTGARGIPEMCYLEWATEELSGRVARECALRGLLFKRNAYNFVSLAHRAQDIEAALGTLEEVMQTC
ncbi:MAG TPA: aminotransferase class III-fold pyridoxal phosphate-dependent enzyme [Gemmatimonadales bacterium]|nr:aminotransferase class III-fold pyridoxal phosphate-dependent enzyme [Gemmatimonadales bacterium]